MPTVIGILLASAIVALGRIAGLDRDRAYYPVALIIIGSYYVLFAIMVGDRAALVGELIFAGFFATIAVVGFRISLWIVAIGMAMHGVFDFTRDLFLPGSGVPPWWPAFCGSIDIALAFALAALLLLGRSVSVPARDAS
ncbi:MAG: hypothetical protein AB7K04_13905 [Pseudorhodoplanes sp.]